jgi:hypothetical protein
MKDTHLLPPRPRGVKDGAFAAPVPNEAFLPVGWILAGVKEGDSTLNAFLELLERSLAMTAQDCGL